MGGKELKILYISILKFMDWEFTEDNAFKALHEAFKENEESSAIDFLVSDGASFYLELIQNAAGEGIDLSDSVEFHELQYEIVEMLDKLCSK